MPDRHPARAREETQAEEERQQNPINCWTLPRNLRNPTVKSCPAATEYSGVHPACLRPAQVQQNMIGLGEEITSTDFMFRFPSENGFDFRATWYTLEFGPRW